jgi:Trk-type K+ transport system membrane component
MKYLLFALILFNFLSIPVFAQDRPGGLSNSTVNCVDCDIDSNIGLEEIRVPIFASFIDFNTQNASIFSWLSFLGALATIGLVVFWIFLLIKAGVKGMQSQGNPENVAEAFKQVQSVLIGAIVTLFFPFVLSVIGVFLGIGTIFSWPKMFQFCNETTEYQFYYQALLARDQGSTEQRTPDQAEAACQPLGN